MRKNYLRERASGGQTRVKAISSSVCKSFIANFKRTESSSGRQRKTSRLSHGLGSFGAMPRITFSDGLEISGIFLFFRIEAVNTCSERPSKFHVILRFFQSAAQYSDNNAGGLWSKPADSHHAGCAGACRPDETRVKLGITPDHAVSLGSNANLNVTPLGIHLVRKPRWGVDVV